MIKTKAIATPEPKVWRIHRERITHSAMYMLVGLSMVGLAQEDRILLLRLVGYLCVAASIGFLPFSIYRGIIPDWKIELKAKRSQKPDN